MPAGTRPPAHPHDRLHLVTDGGELRYRDAATGREESMQAYYGAGAKADCLRFGESPEAQIYSSVTASFIEI